MLGLHLVQMDRRIIINADDFGLCQDVNKAVAQAHTDGVLTSATIMTNMPDADEAVELARKMPNLGIGVHLNLTQGRPVSKDPPVKCLLDADGRFRHSPLELAIFSIAAAEIRNAVTTELSAQIQWLIDKGLTPTHLDSHKHIHCFPPVFSLVCHLARRFNIPAVRFSLEPKALGVLPWPLSGKNGKRRARIIRAMAAINRMQNPGLLKSRALLGITHTGVIDTNFFKAVTLYNSASTAEVMTHPAFGDGPGPEKTRLTKHREVELQALCSDRTKQYFNDAGIELVHYGNL